MEAAAVRAEALAAIAGHRGRWPAVTARAVAAAAPSSSSWPSRCSAPGGSLIAWKRGDLADEVAAAQRAVDALGGGTLEGVPVDVPGLEGHVLVVVTRTRPRPGCLPARSGREAPPTVVTPPLLP